MPEEILSRVACATFMGDEVVDLDQYPLDREDIGIARVLTRNH